MARKRQHWNVQLGSLYGYVLDRFARIACPYIFTYSIQKINDPNMIHHRCIHCGQPMRGVESHASDFMMLTKFDGVSIYLPVRMLSRHQRLSKDFES